MLLASAMSSSFHGVSWHNTFLMYTLFESIENKTLCSRDINNPDSFLLAEFFRLLFLLDSHKILFIEIMFRMQKINNFYNRRDAKKYAVIGLLWNSETDDYSFNHCWSF